MFKILMFFAFNSDKLRRSFCSSDSCEYMNYHWSDFELTRSNSKKFVFFLFKFRRGYVFFESSIEGKLRYAPLQQAHIWTFFLSKNRETSLWIHEHISRIQRHSASARDAVSKSEAIHISARCTRQTYRFTTYKATKFIKLIKRFRFLQVWLKSSDIWRCLSELKWELFEAFSKVEILMFFDKWTLKK
jgi:hypothetical protein